MELLKMEPSRKKSKEGDIFIIKVKEDLYFYGRVMRIKVPSTEPFINGWNLIYIYNVPSADGALPTDPLRPDQLMMAPLVMNHQPWLQGYFKTIGTSTVSEEDFARDTGFRVWRLKPTDEYVDVEGNKLDFVPRLSGAFGLSNDLAVESGLKKYLEGLEKGRSEQSGKKISREGWL